MTMFDLEIGSKYNCLNLKIQHIAVSETMKVVQVAAGEAFANSVSWKFSADARYD